MNFKLDENLGTLGTDLLRGAGHDVATVIEQDLSGTADEQLYDACRREDRVLITLDRGFGQVLRFAPEGTAGIVVLECPGQVTPDSILTRIRELLAVLATRPIDRELWIVEPGRVRVHQAKDDPA